MVKKVFGLAAFAIIAVMAGWNYQQRMQESEYSDVALANIEALASEEDIKPGDPCYNDAKYDANKPKSVKCGTPCILENQDIDFWESTSWCN